MMEYDRRSSSDSLAFCSSDPQTYRLEDSEEPIHVVGLPSQSPKIDESQPFPDRKTGPSIIRPISAEHSPVTKPLSSDRELEDVQVPIKNCENSGSDQAEQLDSSVPRVMYDEERRKREVAEEEIAELKEDLEEEKRKREEVEEKNAELKQKIEDLEKDNYSAEKEERGRTQERVARFEQQLYQTRVSASVLKVYVLMRIIQFLRVIAAGCLMNNPLREEQQRINEIFTGDYSCPVCWTDKPCLDCRHLYENHGVAENSDCRCCSKKKNYKHSTLKPIWSHVYPENWLKVVCYYRVIFDAKRFESLTPRDCSWPLLCKEHDKATGDMEKELRERLQDKFYAKNIGFGGKLLQEDADILCIITYRGLLININIRHYEECGKCLQYYRSITDFLKRAHHYSSVYGVKRRPSSEQNKETLTVEQARMLFLFKDSLTEAEAKYYIELPFVCTVDLSDIDTSLGCCPMIYAQFPPLGCFWAFPLWPDQITILQPHFLDIIGRINTALMTEHDKLYDEQKEAKEWLTHLKTQEKERPSNYEKFVKDNGETISKLEQQVNESEEGSMKEKRQERLQKLKSHRRGLSIEIKPRLIRFYLPRCCLEVVKYPSVPTS